MLAPVIGSQLLLVMDWRGIFWVLAAYGAVVILAVSLWIVETRPKSARLASGEKTVLQRFKTVLSDRTFVGIAIVGGMTFTGLFSYLSSSTFLFQGTYGFTAQQYGLLFAANSIGVIIGVPTSSYLMRTVIGPQWILTITTGMMLILGVSIMVLDLTGAGLWGTVIPLWFFITMCGFSFPLRRSSH